jgi:hypothetical protein
MYESHKARCTLSSASCEMIRYDHFVLGVLQAMCSSFSPNTDIDFLNALLVYCEPLSDLISVCNPSDWMGLRQDSILPMLKSTAFTQWTKYYWDKQQESYSKRQRRIRANSESVSS